MILCTPPLLVAALQALPLCVFCVPALRYAARRRVVFPDSPKHNKKWRTNDKKGLASPRPA